MSSLMTWPDCRPSKSARHARRGGGACVLIAACSMVLVGCDSKTEQAPATDTAKPGTQAQQPAPQVPEVSKVDAAARAEEALRYLERARVEKAAGRHAEAVRLFDLSLAASTAVGMPGLAFVERGETRQAMGMFPEALQDYTRAIEINPHRDFRLRRLAIANALGKSELITEDLAALDSCCRDDVEVKRMHESLGR